MYGVKSTSTIINSVARQGVLTKQLVAPKSTAFLSNIQARQVSLSYTTRSQSQFSQQQQQDQTETSGFSQVPNRHWTTVGSRVNRKNNFRSSIDPTHPTNKKALEPAYFDVRILQAAKQNNAKAVVDTFIQRQSSDVASSPLSKKTYEAVIEAYRKLRKSNQPITPMLNAYQDMIQSGVQPSSQTYALLIRSLCDRDSEVQKTVSMLKRQIARTGNAVENLGDLENEKNMEKAVALFNRAVSEKSTQDFDIELYNTLLRGLSFKGNTEDGLYIYEHLESAMNANPNGDTFATLMSLFGCAGDLKAVHECFKEYKSLKHQLPRHDHTYVYNAFVYAHVDAGDITGALEIIDQIMVKDHIKVTILPYNKIFRRACFEGKMETVDEVLTRLETDANLPNPNATTYGIILSAYARLENFEKATKVYNSMLQYDVSRQYGHIADYAYACTSHEMPDQAFKVVQDMTERGLELDSNLLQKVVTSFISCGRMKDAVRSLTSMVEMYSKSNYLDDTSPVSRLALDVATKCNDLSSAISILQVLGNYSIRPNAVVSEVVLKLYRQTRAQEDQWKSISKDLNERSYFILYDAAFHQENSPMGFCQLAFDLLKDMNELHLSPSTSLYVRVLTRMKKYEATDHELRWKAEFAPYIQDPKPVLEAKQVPPAETRMTVESDLLSGKALDAAITGKFEDAHQILAQEIIKKGNVPTPEAVRDIIQAGTKAGRLDAVENIYRTVIDSIEKGLEGGSRKQRAYHVIFNAMLIAHARHGTLDSAKVYYDKLRARELYPDGDAYGALLACSANSTTDESNDALAIYEEAKKHNVRPTVYFYNVIISKLAKCRKIEPVLHLFEEMKQLGIGPNSITYASVISACIRCSSEGRAGRYFQEMIQSPKYQPRIGAYNSMIQFYVQQKPNREKALEYFNLSKQFNLKPSHHTYKLLMEAYANIPAYDMLTAHKLLSEMNKRHGLQPTASHYATLIRSYGCLHRDVQSALAVYKEMQKANIKADETVYQAMLNTLIDNNDLKSAEKLYQEMLESGTKSSSYIENLFIAGYGAHGNVKMAEKVFVRMNDLNLVKEPSTYEAMVKAYVENNQKESAQRIVDQMLQRDFPPKVVEGVVQLVYS